jgi:hypothetical protein
MVEDRDWCACSGDGHSYSLSVEEKRSRACSLAVSLVAPRANHR